MNYASHLSLFENIKGLLFDHKGRISRSTYFSSILLLVLLNFLALSVMFLLIHLIAYVSGSSGSSGSSGFSEAITKLIVSGIMLFTVYAYCVLTMKRLHDLGHSGWYVLLYFVPIFNLLFYLYLLFKGSHHYDNKYGECNYYDLSRGFKLFACGFACLLFLGYKGVSSLGYQQVHGLIERLPASVQKSLTSNGSLATITIDGKVVGFGTFITNHRFMVRGHREKEFLLRKFRIHQTIEVVNFGGKVGKVSGFIASNESVLNDLAVFQVDQPIGKPANLKEDQIKELKRIKAFQ